MDQNSIASKPLSQKNLNAQLAKTVKRLRLEKGLSQEELAVLAHVDRTYISGIERARRNITIATLERLIPHLSQGSVDFFEELNREIVKSDQSQQTPTPREHEIGSQAAIA